ncbi:Ger(x)C family spore germination protein [Gracilibacillus caseinilyticus]|uniref:Ger(X)C family spore germination protein n=1 Tax=Gracilibacillus caseinilyticus TaxID=2932256 RepID=A0ABY4F0Y8_9BACI|nr:Ger(x)C family spore germination protein [Gracilibacillus caseinilyticus]UOQ49559.1 Ger(x)C family spore germination protein [Gracilibacillus caseinilyticus]
MMNKLWIVFGLLILLTGCYDRIELEQQSYVIAMGIDKTENKGVYAFTYQIANPEVGSAAGQGGSNEPASEIVTVHGADILSATYTANSFVSKKITLDHTRIIVISEELARNPDFIRVIQSASRSPQIRRGVQLVVSKEKASEFINNNQPVMEQRPHKYFQFMLDRADQTGIIPAASLHRFFQITEGDADLFLAIYASTKKDKKQEQGKNKLEDEYIAGQIPQLGGSPTQFMGAGVFKEGKMIDTLDGEEVRIVHILDNTLELNNYLTTMPDPFDPEFQLSYNYSQKQNAKVDITYHQDKPTEIDVLVPFQIEVIAIPSLIRYAHDQEKQDALENAITKRLEEKTMEIIKKAQEQYKSDPFYWSLYIRHEFTNIKQYEKADWHKKIFPNAEVNVTYQLDKLEFGKMLDDSNLDRVRD